MYTTLQDGESIVSQYSPARRSGLFAYYVIGVLTAPAVIGLLILLGLEIHVRGTSYYLTDRRVIKEFKFGIIRNRIIPYENITHTSTGVSMVDRYFESGYLQIKTAGTSGIDMRLNYLKNPKNLEKEVSKRT
ncbi:MAG: PH domain-containing protein [Candidatus Nanohaloarchaea archaeon]